MGHKLAKSLFHRQQKQGGRRLTRGKGGEVVESIHDFQEKPPANICQLPTDPIPARTEMASTVLWFLLIPCGCFLPVYSSSTVPPPTVVDSPAYTSYIYIYLSSPPLLHSTVHTPVKVKTRGVFIAVLVPASTAAVSNFEPHSRTIAFFSL